MYFEGDPYNETDPFLKSAGRKELLITKLRTPSPEFEPDLKNGDIRHCTIQRIAVVAYGIEKLAEGKISTRAARSTQDCTVLD
jgi:hypothetical protein